MTCTKCQQEKSENEFYRGYHWCKSCWSAYVKQYRSNHADLIAQYNHRDYKLRKKQIQAKNRRNYYLHREEYLKTKKAWRTNPCNRPRINETRRKYVNRRLKMDMKFRLLKNLRNRIHGIMRYGVKKSFSTMILLGCSIHEFKTHIEKQFQPRMSWENYGEWQIDHIKPCSLFDLTNPEEQKICFHFSNMQPLWKRDNQIKGKKYGVSLT